MGCGESSLNDVTLPSVALDSFLPGYNNQPSSSMELSYTSAFRGLHLENSLRNVPSIIPVKPKQQLILPSSQEQQKVNQQPSSISDLPMATSYPSIHKMVKFPSLKGKETQRKIQPFVVSEKQLQSEYSLLNKVISQEQHQTENKRQCECSLKLLQKQDDIKDEDIGEYKGEGINEEQMDNKQIQLTSIISKVNKAECDQDQQNTRLKQSIVLLRESDDDKQNQEMVPGNQRKLTIQLERVSDNKLYRQLFQDRSNKENKMKNEEKEEEIDVLNHQTTECEQYIKE